MSTRSIIRTARQGMPITLGGRRFRIDRVESQDTEDGSAEVVLVTETGETQHIRTTLSQDNIAAASGWEWQ